MIWKAKLKGKCDKDCRMIILFVDQFSEPGKIKLELMVAAVKIFEQKRE